MGCSQCNSKSSQQTELISEPSPVQPVSSAPTKTSLPISKKSIATNKQLAVAPEPAAEPKATTSQQSKPEEKPIPTSKSLVENYLNEVYQKAEKAQPEPEPEPKPKPVEVAVVPESPSMVSATRRGTGSPSLCIKRDSFVRVANENVNLRYVFQAKLGEGAYGCVFRCVDKASRAIKAIKVIKKRTMKNSGKFFAELEILKTLDHPNIIKLYEVFDHNDFYYVVTEYCGGGELFEVVRGSERVTEKSVAYIMRQVLSAVNYMHKKGIVHRDLKPENIVLEIRRINESMRDSPIKLIDFGTAIRLEPKKYLTDQVGSPYYVAPEVLESRYNEKCDLWSCGVILYTMLCGSPPFKGRTTEEIFNNIQNSSASYQEKIWPRISAGARDLVKQLLQKNPTKRISAEQALAHTWIHECDSTVAIDSSVLQNLEQFYFKNKFLAIVETYIGTNEVSQEDRRRLAEKFQEIDKDNSGSIETAELVSAFKTIYGEKYTEEAINEMVANIDSNGSGKIDFTEFIVAIQTTEKLCQKGSLQTAFDFFDKDKTGFLEVSEIKELLGNSSEDEILQLLNNIDVDDDKKISKEEFVAKLLGK